MSLPGTRSVAQATSRGTATVIESFAYLFSSLLLLAFAGGLFWLVRFIARQLQVESAACPKCAHVLQAPIESLCPKCGWSLEAGVLAAGGIPPRPRQRLGIAALALSVPVSILVFIPSSFLWNSFLTMANVIQHEVVFNQTMSFMFDSKDRLEVVGSADFVDPMEPWSSAKTATGAVEVQLSSGGREIASWKGMVPFEEDAAGSYFVINGEDVVDSLRSQVPQNSESSLSRILHHPGDAEILAKAIVFYTAPKAVVLGSVSFPAAGVSGYVTGNSSEHKLPDGFTVSSYQGGKGPSQVNPLWYLPIFLIPLVFFLAFLLLGLRILNRGRRLALFSRQSSEWTHVSHR